MKLLIQMFATILLIITGCAIAWVIVDLILQFLAMMEVRNIGKIEFY